MSQSADQSFNLIQSAHGRGRLAHAFLISGALGSGKENLASRLTSMVNSDSGGGFDLFGDPVVDVTPPLDEQEGGWVRIIRPRSKSRRISVAEIRDLEHTLQLAAPSGKTKVGVIVDADRMNEQAENAFLKTLEEPPSGTLLLLLTTKPQRLLPTILSRCLQVKLTGGSALGAEGGDKLVQAFTKAARRGLGDPITALNMKAVFTQFLSSKRDEVDAAAKAATKEEISTYRDGTDGSWLKEREDFHKATAEADYLEARNRYLDVILAWLADGLRIKTGSAGLDFPEQFSQIEKIVEHESLHSIAKRLDALERLRQSLETNASEPLTLEVGFLRAFA